MKKSEIVEIIEANSDLSYAELMKQAVDSGVSAAEFALAYEVHKANEDRKNIKYILGGVGFGLGLLALISPMFFILNPIAGFLGWLTTRLVDMNCYDGKESCAMIQGISKVASYSLISGLSYFFLGFIIENIKGGFLWIALLFGYIAINVGTLVLYVLVAGALFS